MNNTPAYQAFLFDLDGTLIDSAHSFWQVINDFREQENKALQEIQVVRTATALGGSALATLCFDIPEETPGFLPYKEKFLTAYSRYLKAYPVPLFDGIEEILHFLNEKNIPWGIVTNKQKRFTRLTLSQHPILSKAATVVSGDTLAFTKPHPAPLLHASISLQRPPAQTLYIGDQKVDVDAGRTAGMATGIALYGYVPDEAAAQSWGANYLFKTPQELQTWIQSRL